MAELNRFCSFFSKKKLFWGLIFAHTRKKTFFFGGAKGPFLGLIPLIPEKKPFLCFVVFRFTLILAYTRKKSFFFRVPKKKGFFIRKYKGYKDSSNPCTLYTPLYSKKKTFFLKFQKMELAYTSLILGLSFFFQEKKAFFLAQELNSAMKLNL